LQEDLDVMSLSIAQQSNAVVIVHEGWADHARFEPEYLWPDSAGQMRHSRPYFDDLVSPLKTRFPNREFRRMYSTEFMAQVFYDAQNGIGPFEQLSDIYRDSIHTTFQTGRYLMHNAMRCALGQPPSDKPFILTTEEKHYLDQVLATVLDPSVYQDTPGYFLPVDDQIPFWSGQTNLVTSHQVLWANDTIPRGEVSEPLVHSPQGIVQSIRSENGYVYVGLTNAPSATNCFFYGYGDPVGSGAQACVSRMPLKASFPAATNRLAIANLGERVLPMLAFQSAAGVTKLLQRSEDMENWITIETNEATEAGRICIATPEHRRIAGGIIASSASEESA
jgi:hypothetical protein